MTLMISFKMSGARFREEVKTRFCVSTLKQFVFLKFKKQLLTVFFIMIDLFFGRTTLLVAC